MESSVDWRVFAIACEPKTCSRTGYSLDAVSRDPAQTEVDDNFMTEICMGAVTPAGNNVQPQETRAEPVNHHPEDDANNLSAQANPEPPKPDATATATDAEIREAKEADEAAKAAAAAASAFPPAVRESVVQDANSAAKKEWQDVSRAVTTELQTAANSVKDPNDIAARNQAISDRAQAITQRASDDPKVRQITLDAQLTLTRAQPAAVAIARAYGPEIGPKNLPAAEAEYKRQIEGATPEQVAAINQAASPTLDAIAETRARQVELAYASGGPAAAATALRTQTEAAPPEIAARVLEQSQPTIKEITNYLGEAQRSDYFAQPRGRGAGSYIDHYPKVHKMYEDLAAATNAASGTVRGDQMTQQIARDLVQAVPPGKLGQLDASIGKAIANGSGAELGVAVVRELKAAGRVNEAQDVAQDVGDGLKSLKARFDDTAKNYAKVNEEKFYLQSSYAYLANSGDPVQQKKLQEFWQKYDKDHPEIAQAQAELDRVTTQVIEATTAIDAGKDAFSGLKDEKKINEAQKALLEDPNLMNAISLSPVAQKALADQTTQQRINETEAKTSFADQAYSPFKARNFLEVLRDSGSQGRNASLRGGIVMTKYFMREATLAAKAGDPNAAKAAIDKLRAYEDVLGYSGARKANFDKMLSSFKDMVDAGSDVDAAKVAFDKFKAASGDAANGPTYDPSSKAGAAIRMLGTAFALDAVRRDVDKITSGSAEFKDYTRTLVDTISASQQSLMVLAGLAKAGGLRGGATSVALLDKFGDQVPYAGAVVDLIFAADEFLSADGDKVQGSLYAASAAGNIALATGFSLGSEATLLGLSGAAWTGIGAVVLAVTFVGTLGWQQYRHSQEASKFETPLTEDYLKTLGVKPEIARELRNQDGDGNSPGPVLRQVAESRGLKLDNPAHMKAFVDYLNSLSKDQMHNLVEAAHNVDPNEKGEYKMSATQKEALLALPADPSKLVSDRSGSLINPATGEKTQIQYDAKEKRWFDPVSQMAFYEKGDRWVFAGRMDDSKIYTQPINYYPETGMAVYSDLGANWLEPESVEGLSDWMRQRGYPELRAP
jgi:hypothetical protein